MSIKYLKKSLLEPKELIKMAKEFDNLDLIDIQKLQEQHRGKYNSKGTDQINDKSSITGDFINSHNVLRIQKNHSTRESN